MATKTFHRFMDLPPELRLMVYERLPRTTKYVTAGRDEHGDPVVVFVFNYIEREILKTCKHVEEKAGPIIDRLTKECGPARLIADCEYFHGIPDILMTLTAATNSGVQSLNNAKKELEDVEDKDEMLVWEEEMDPYMEEMWIRLATRYLMGSGRIKLGVWVSDAGCTTFLSNLETVIDDISSLQWSAFGNWFHSPTFVVTIESPDDANSDDAQNAAQDLEEDGFEVFDDMGPAEMELKWDVQTFDGLFERVKDEETKAQERGEESDDSSDGNRKDHLIAWAGGGSDEEMGEVSDED